MAGQAQEAQREMSISELAKEMNVTETDVKGFIIGLSIWTNKGFSFEEAIEKHMAQMTRFTSNADQFYKTPEGKNWAVEAFYE